MLENIVSSSNYADLLETWRVPEVERFSKKKTLYDYQRSALENAARALYHYYEQENDWQANEIQDANKEKAHYVQHII